MGCAPPGVAVVGAAGEAPHLWWAGVGRRPAHTHTAAYISTIHPHSCIHHSCPVAEEAKEEAEVEAAPEFDAAAGFAAAPLPGGEEAAGFDAYG